MSQRRWVWLILLATLGVRLYWASGAPLANDEAYYWDWSRTLQLSYLDHPPAVAFIAAIGEMLTPLHGALGPRLLLPFLHLAATLLMLASTESCKGTTLTRGETFRLLALCEAVPAFSLEGLLLLPDSGLLLALAAALYCMINGVVKESHHEDTKQRWLWSGLAGLALGAAGLCKYHAAPIGVGLGLGYLGHARSRGRLQPALGSLGFTATVALLVTAPVWLWNAQHDWASFRFQGAHGFADLNFEPLAALRVYLGQLVILTPLVWIGSGLVAWRQRHNPRARIMIAAAMLLFVPLEILAVGKQQLPHWLAPACWMMVPLLALAPWPRWAWRTNLTFALVIAWILPWVLAVPPLRQALVDAFHGTPGPLSELTLWEPLAASLVQDSQLAPYLSTHNGAGPCPMPVTVASLRWFWSAQLAFHLPGQPSVLSLDLNHRSFYSFRDAWPAYADCPVLVIADARHVDEQQLHSVIREIQRVSVVVPSHRDTAVVAVLGQFRPRADLEALQASLDPAGGRHPSAY